MVSWKITRKQRRYFNIFGDEDNKIIIINFDKGFFNITNTKTNFEQTTFISSKKGKDTSMAHYTKC